MIKRIRIFHLQILEVKLKRMKTNLFDEQHVLHELTHYLPTQTPLKDFIHHNSLHAFQYKKFYDAIFTSSKIFGHQATLSLPDFRKLFKIGRINAAILDRTISEAKGKDNVTAWTENVLNKNYDEHIGQRIGLLRANWKQTYQIDLDNLVQPLLFRVLCSYLDQGIAIWDFPIGNVSFLEAIKHIEQNSFTSLFKTKRAKQLILQENIAIVDLLNIIVGNESYFEQYLFDQQFSHRGWSGLVATVEAQPHTLLSPKQISLHDLIVFELLLEIDNLDFSLGKNWQPIASNTTQAPINLFDEVPNTELHEVIKIWQSAFEWSYYDEVLAGIRELGFEKQNGTLKTNTVSNKSFQAMFCIDERECSIRRHIESIDTNCETLGSPGFFGVEF
jgi:uncharacterized protein